MPTYDYACEACGHRFERYQEMSEKKLRTCPKCGKRRLARLVGAGAGLIFRGTGFYVTDYKRAGESGKDGAEKGGEPKADPKSGSPSDSKPGSTSDSKSAPRPESKRDAKPREASGGRPSERAAPPGAKTSGKRAEGS
jgi:putative FmdB family regulatory protein